MLKHMKRTVSLLLCCIMLMPTQLVQASIDLPSEGIMVEEIAETIAEDIDSLEEITVETELLDDKSEDNNHYQEILPIKPLEPIKPADPIEPIEWDGDLVIYWNPGGDQPEIDDLPVRASISDATTGNATIGQSGNGSDHADGLTPATPVHSLNTAIRRAEKLSRQMEVELSDITIYAMNPMVVPQNVIYTVRGRGVTISAWEGRSDDSQYIFIIAGGQLSLSNMILQPNDSGLEPAEASLVYIGEGKVQLGEKVESYGSFVMNYDNEPGIYDPASESRAIASGSDSDRYIEPVIELQKRFDAPAEYFLDLVVSDERESITPVQALYSDTSSAGEFMESFVLVDNPSDEWNLIVEERVGGVLRDTTEEQELDIATAAEASARKEETVRKSIDLTQKSLVASRSLRAGQVIYWNPGPNIVIDGTTYLAGNDQSHDGTVPEYPVRTWENARAKADGGTIINMRSIDLATDATDILGPLVNGSYVLDGKNSNTTTISAWEKNALPVLVIPDGVTVTLENITLLGVSKAGNFTGSQMILNQGGQLILEKNIENSTGYIQVDLVETNQAKDHPIIVRSDDVYTSLYFGNIHHNIGWRYQDVIIADGELLALGEDLAGDILLQNTKLERANSVTIEHGGLSEYQWLLRKDTDEDDAQAHPSRIELYAEYYFDAVYLDGVRGNDQNYGATCHYPIQSFEKAKQILDTEMRRSVEARRAATSDEARNKIDLPKTIYICGTVTVTDQQLWELPTFTDWDDSIITVEIKTHTEPFVDEDQNQPIHQIPELLIHVKGSSASLTLGEGIIIRSIANQANSYTVAVTEGAKLFTEKNAVLTGLTDAHNENSQTLGTHILVGKSSPSGNVTSGTVEMSSGWTGSIDGRGIGIEAYGASTRITMKDGMIKNHLNPTASYAGIYLNQATFIMNGGKITGNSCLYNGAGVYLANYATFEMPAGVIEKNKSTLTSSAVRADGVGVFVGANSTFGMGTLGGNNDDAVIADQESDGTYRGVGVYVESGGTFRLYSGTIRNNRGRGSSGAPSNSYTSNGAGVYNAGTLIMTDGLITQNGAKEGYNYSNLLGAGMYLAGPSQTITGGTISDNRTGLYYTTSVSYTNGGGISVANVATIKNVIVENNRSQLGAGIAVYGNSSNVVTIANCTIRNNIGTTSFTETVTNPQGEGAGIYSYGKVAITDCQITDNWANYGGGIAHRSNILISRNNSITNNQASYGGGIYSTSTVYLNGGVISHNLANVQGGGVFNNSAFYSSNIEITDNTAITSGGGIYNSTSATTHLTEHGDNQTKLVNNQAQYGGGIYQYGGILLIDITGLVQNKAVGARAQGNNVYMTQYSTYESTLSLLNGNYQQPTDSEEGVYNFYLTSDGNNTAQLRIDFSKCVVGGEKYIYLATTNNFLSYLQKPPTNDFGVFPIDVNDAVFSIGSVIIKPANLSSVTLYRMKENEDVILSYAVTYTALTDASVNVSYSDGGSLPLRTQLGGYPDSLKPNLTNIVLVGEGVYLKGAVAGNPDLGGKDTNGGTSPTDAVATFARAKEVLELRTDALNAVDGSSGYSPFIYICGNVNVSANQIWELDYDEARYTTDSNYVVTEEAAGRQVEQAQIKRFTSFLSAPMVTVEGTNTTVTVPKLIINGMSESVVTKDQENRSPIFYVSAGSSLILEGDAWIRNNYKNTIEVYGRLSLTGDESASNHQVDLSRGDGVNLYAGGIMEMDEYARVVISRYFRDNTSFTSYPTQGYANRGVIIRPNSSLTMSGNSKIEYTGQPETTVSASNSLGVLIGSSAKTTNQATLVMKGNASIVNNRAGIAIDHYNIDIQLYDQASVTGNQEGIYSYARGRDDISITLDGYSSVSGNGARGIYFEHQSSGVMTDTIKVNIIDHGSIKNNGTYGVQMYNMYPQLQLTMANDGSIVNNRSGGIIEASYAHRSSIITMKDNSWIGAEGNGIQSVGIQYSTGPEFSGNKTDLYQIIMSDNAMIGGSEYYTGTGAKKGNTGYGIYTNKPIKISMSDHSKISYNGLINNSYAGIYLGSYSSSYSGDSTITLSDFASICNNGGYAIRSDDKLLNTGVYDRYEKIIIKDQASIKDNSYGMTFMPNSDVYLQDDAYIGAPSGSTVDSIMMYGSLHMDGTVTVEGRIHLYTGTKPITLTKAIPLSSSSEKYRLHLAEGYVGQVVVKPDGEVLDNVTGYLNYFVKEIGDGLGATKQLVPSDKNIVLENENNVYLSGYGNDTYNGYTPSTAVRTFKRAKEILETGTISSGANIIICDVPGKSVNIPVQVLIGDEDWSFDDGGFVTNQVNQQRWKPIVYRHEKYSGVMIQLNQGVTTTTGHSGASSITFKDITIDGRGDLDTVANNRLYLKSMLNIKKGSVTLADGATMRNNRTNMADTLLATQNYAFSALGVYVEATGSLVVDGGIIEEMKFEKVNNSYSLPLGVAIYNQGTVQIKDGLVRNNEITFTSNHAERTFIAAAVINRNTASLTMSGGSITNNEITLPVGKLPDLRGGALSFIEDAGGSMKGGLISDNKGGKGAGIYYAGSSSLELEGGRVRSNQALSNTKSLNEYAPIYIASNKFWMKGGGAVLDDPIYLDSTDNIISISANIYQTTRRYQVFLNRGTGTKQFQKGSVVVQPDGNFMLDASQFLINFDVHSNPYVLDRGQSVSREGGTIPGVKESQCLLLMQAVFLDSKNGKDTNDGKLPNTAVETFAKAKDLGEGRDKSSLTKDYFIIYLSGPAYHKPDEVWELGDRAYMNRYTGFEVYQEDGTPTPQRESPYNGYLIESQGDLTLQQIRIYGRRVIDDTSSNGDSIISVRKGHTVTVKGDTLLSRNYNVGSYLSAETGLLVALTMKGGAATVETGGTLHIEGGSITDVEATYGSAIYQDADTAIGGSSFGHVFLDQSPDIHGDLFLNGQLHGAQAYVEVTDAYQPFTSGRVDGRLRIRLANDYSGRPVIKYPAGIEPTLDQIKYYQLDDSVTAIYDFARNIIDESLLELRLRQLLYVDGQNGSDSNSGSSPQDALGTVRGVYETARDMGASSGALIFVVGTIEIGSGVNMTLTNEAFQSNGQIFYKGTYQDGAGTVEIDSQIYFKRYAQPETTTASGFNVETNLESLFDIKKDGSLSINGIYLDGHSEESVSSFDYLCAKGVPALSPLISVAPGGNLKAGNAQTNSIPGSGDNPGQIGMNTTTLFSNNSNVNSKTKVLGMSAQDLEVREGSSAGIEILSDATSSGTARLEGIEFRKLSLGNGVDGGSDVYQNGRLIVLRQTIFSGSVMLEGLGSKGNPSSSRYIEAGEYGTPFKNNFKVFLRDPYNTRAVVSYPNSDANGPLDRDIGYFLLEEKVNRYYALSRRETAKHILELTVPLAVYIDGTNGIDTNGGWKPTIPVKTMQKAYERLKESGGKVIYVIGTVDISTTTDLSATSYEAGVQKVSLLGSTDHVDIRRYVRPRAGNPGVNQDPDYRLDDFTGTLFKVKNGAVLTLKENIYLDGHYEKKIEPEYTNEFYVDHTTEVTSPLIEVEKGGTLKLQEGAILKDNHNTKTLSGSSSRVPGGAIKNDGQVELQGGQITGNAAEKGAGIYQNGQFEIVSSPQGIESQEIYLTTENNGTESAPDWGADHILDVNVLLPSELKLDLNMDHAIVGRPVIRYSSHAGVDSQYINYQLGETVPLSLYLVENQLNDSLLELQDWRILDISVPQEIFLVIQQTRTGLVTAANGATDQVSLSSPEYTIKNRGRYDAKITLAGFVNENTAAGITSYETMNLVASPSDALSETASRKDLYLAIKGADTTDKFAALEEISLSAFGTDGDKKQEMGTLLSGEEGAFVFVAAASRRFMSYYADHTFPFFGSEATAADRINHIRHKNAITGDTSPNQARAKYKMTYRVEIIPPRR